MARPLKKIDPLMVEKLAGVGCTDEEIATILETSHDTLRRRFAYHLEKGRGNRKMSLRRKQTEIALSGNVGMLIWLGKQDLGQKDQQKVEQDGAMTLRVITNVQDE